MKTKGIKAVNFWVCKVKYFTQKTAQEFFTPKKLAKCACASSECYDACGADSGCASDSDCAAGSSCSADSDD